MNDQPLAKPRPEAQRWAGLECYLDGKLARIGGRMMPFATVAALDGSASAQFAWETVNRIMYGRMEFFTH